ncbi:MAG: hypothetical protein ABR584_05095 [Candidatus Baltobacteraceae bacterium]
MLSLSYLLLAAALNIATVTPTPAPLALKEIGHVKATAACAELALHANTAISSALRNDAVVGNTIAKLQNLKLDGNAVTRRNDLQAMGDLAKDLHGRAVYGIAEVKKLREIAEKSTDAVQKKELKDFADELGGALYRQKKIAQDLNGLLATYDYHDMRPSSDELTNYGMTAQPLLVSRTSAQPASEQSSKNTDLRSYPSQPGHSVFDSSHTDTELAQFAASDFMLRVPDITNDEALAANHAEGAVSGC